MPESSGVDSNELSDFSHRYRNLLLFASPDYGAIESDCKVKGYGYMPIRRSLEASGSSGYPGREQ